MRPLLCLLLFAASLLHAADFLPGAKRIVFLGDSITYAGQYVDRFEAFLLTQYPGRTFEVIDCGLPSETVSGLSEPGHANGQFPRPDLHERLARVLAKTKPDLVFACYGMNDGIYLPFAEDRFAKFREGMLWLHEAVEKSGAKIIHLTPPVFDPGPGKDRATSYDDVLARFSAWLLEQRTQSWQVIDLHGPMSAALEAGRKADPNFVFAKDHVHPDDAGHTILADALLAGLDPEHFATFQKITLPPGVAAKIRQRRSLLSNAWLTETGHTRPGMAKGLPLAEAQEKAAALTQEIHP